MGFKILAGEKNIPMRANNYAYFIRGLIQIHLLLIGSSFACPKYNRASQYGDFNLVKVKMKILKLSDLQRWLHKIERN